jgi:hypothetical protein
MVDVCTLAKKRWSGWDLNSSLSSHSYPLWVIGTSQDGLGRGFNSHPVHLYQSGKLRYCFELGINNCRTNSAAMHIEDIQRLVTEEIEKMLKVVLLSSSRCTRAYIRNQHSLKPTTPNRMGFTHSGLIESRTMESQQLI